MCVKFVSNMREECRLRVFKYYIMRSFMICTAHQILFR